MCIVSEGQIELRFSVSHYCASKEITPDRINKGEIFGWSALANPYTYTFSANAVKDSELLRIKQSEFEEVCRKNNGLGYVLMNKITQIISVGNSSAGRAAVLHLLEYGGYTCIVFAILSRAAAAVARSRELQRTQKSMPFE